MMVIQMSDRQLIRLHVMTEFPGGWRTPEVKLAERQFLILILRF
jgi:hypothetical protein